MQQSKRIAHRGIGLNQARTYESEDAVLATVMIVKSRALMNAPSQTVPVFL